MMKSVQFEELVKVKTLRHHTDIESVCASWFSRDEIDAMRVREKRLSKKVAAHKKKGEIVFVHGLETSESRQQRRTVVRQSQLVVLLLQEEPWARNDEDPEKLAKAYSDYTSQYVDAAKSRAVAYRPRQSTTKSKAYIPDRRLLPQHSEVDRCSYQTTILRTNFRSHFTLML
jgi:hypothetical protein